MDLLLVISLKREKSLDTKINKDLAMLELSWKPIDAILEPMYNQ